MKDLKADVARLRQLSAAELCGEYKRLFGAEPRVRFSKEFLWKRICWKLEERRCGGLSDVARRRLEQLVAEIDLPAEEQTRSVSGALVAPRRSQGPKPGVEYVRDYKGRTVRARPVEGGYEYDGQVYTSLSAVAKAVTNSAWNGKLFFGVTKRRRRS